MSRIPAVLLALLLLPTVASAATFAADRTIVLSSSPEGNAYLAGGNVRVNAPVSQDLVVAAGTVVVVNTIAGDLLATGGTVESRGAIAGDVRIAGGRLIIESEIAGDLTAAGGVVSVPGKARYTYIVGGTIELTGGAAGPVELYGANVLLSGEFLGDVDVVASDHVTVAEGTVIRGALRYNAPQQALIPESALVVGGVEYTGSSAFLPTVEEAQTFAIAGAGVFLVVQVISGLLAAGIIGGLFPTFARLLSERALFSGVRRFLLLFLLGFALLVATPVLLLLLSVTFVGIGIAIVIGATYLLLLALSYLYAAVLAGAALSRAAFKRSLASWQEAVIGMIALQIIALVPHFGSAIVFILCATAVGAIAASAFSFAFPKSDSENF